MTGFKMTSNEKFQQSPADDAKMNQNTFGERTNHGNDSIYCTRIPNEILDSGWLPYIIFPFESTEIDTRVVD